MPHPKVRYDDYDTWDEPVAVHPSHESLEDDTDSCPYCQSVIYSDSERCPSCGSYLSLEEEGSQYQKYIPIWVGVLLVLSIISIIYWILH